MEKYICDKCNKEFAYKWDRKVEQGYPALCDKHRYLNYSCQDEEWTKDRRMQKFYIPKTAKCCDGTDCIIAFYNYEIAKLHRLMAKEVCHSMEHPHKCFCVDSQRNK